jgi:hypothetical protein
MSKFLLSFLSLILVSTSLSAQVEDDGRFYPNPGIVAQRNGRWIGSDHLYNLTDRIEIVAEIFKPRNTELAITEEMIRSRVADIFREGGIKPMAEEKAGQPPLPFFHILVMVYPIDKGYVCYTEGRLFEKVNLDRIVLDEQTALQGITWESQNLILSPQAELKEQVSESVDEIAKTFVDRFQFYEDIRRKIKSN